MSVWRPVAGGWVNEATGELRTTFTTTAGDRAPLWRQLLDDLVAGALDDAEDVRTHPKGRRRRAQRGAGPLPLDRLPAGPLAAS